MPDSFTASFDGQVVSAAIRLLEFLNYKVFVAPVEANGKVQHVLGMLDAFRRTARRAQEFRTRLGGYGLPIISLDAATGLLFDAEYQEAAPLEGAVTVLSLDEFLAGEIRAGRILPKGPAAGSTSFDILLHCTEKTARPETALRWAAIFEFFGLNARTPSLGCCGMSGLFGHESENAGLSRRLFESSWRPTIAGSGSRRLLATGFSCRCQSKRMTGERMPHPVEALLSGLAVRTA